MIEYTKADLDSSRYRTAMVFEYDIRGDRIAMPRDLAQQLARQLGFLVRSCRLYDEGYEDEAIRMATSLRVLFHHTGIKPRESQSLLFLLERQKPRMISTCEPDPHPTFVQTNLTDTAMNPDQGLFRSIPRGIPDGGGSLVSFDQWWDSEVVYAFTDESKNQRKLTRRKLILTAANQDGGAHVDAKLDQTYDAVVRGMGSYLTLNPPGGAPSSRVGLGAAHLAAIRQIALEVLASQDVISLCGPHEHDAPPIPIDVTGSKIIRWRRNVEVWDT